MIAAKPFSAVRATRFLSRLTNCDTAAHPPSAVTPTRLAEQLAAELDSGRSIPVLTGPTGSGKTDLLIQLRERLGGDRPFDVISADAFQVYRRMDIGTAKPSTTVQGLIQHHLIDIRDPSESYSAGLFSSDAAATIQELRERGVRVVVCGGSGLYLSALTKGLHESAEANPELRASNASPEELLVRLRRSDPVAAESLRGAPRPRIIRAIEICEGAGMTLERIRATPPASPRFEFAVFAPGVERSELYRRINERVLRMMREGLVEEVEALRASGIRPDHLSQRAIGYREVHAYLDGLIDRDEMIRLIQRNTRRYAKRQETWMRHQKK
jgi:tRNA dimethylallyltransferase